MQYSVVRHSSIAGLNKLVNKAIKEGWEPQGGVSVFMVNSFWGAGYCQAMIHRADRAAAAIDEGDATIAARREPTLIEKIVGTILVLGIIAGAIKLFF